MKNFLLLTLLLLGNGCEPFVVEFPDFNTAKECYESNEYQKALSHINKSANRTVAIVEGLT